MKLRVQVPASTSNLGPGFDCLGLALDLPLVVELETVGSSLRIEVAGEQTEGIALDSSNLVYASLARILRKRGVGEPGMRIRIENQVPLQRGLGSSGAAAVAGVVLGLLLADNADPERTALLNEAAEIEGHPDNVAPSVYGGFMASCKLEAGFQALPLEFPEHLQILLLIPDRTIATTAARKVLPESIPWCDAVFNISRLGLLLAALSSKTDEALREAMRDRLHQNRRLGLVPGLTEALQALLEEPDCLAATISGSGPTLLALYRDLTPTAGSIAVSTLESLGIPALRRRASVQRAGAQWQRL